MHHKLLLSKIILILLLSFSAISAQSFISSVPPSKNGTLTIIIGGFENDNGECWIALDNSEVVYESDDSVFIGKDFTNRKQRSNCKDRFAHLWHLCNKGFSR